MMNEPYKYIIYYISRLVRIAEPTVNPQTQATIVSSGFI